MNARQFNDLIRRVTENDPTLKKLSLGYMDTWLSNDKLIALGQALRTNTHLEILDLSGCVLDGTAIPALTDGLKASGIRQLDLRRMQFKHLLFACILLTEIGNIKGLHTLLLGNSLTCHGHSVYNLTLSPALLTWTDNFCYKLSEGLKKNKNTSELAKIFDQQIGTLPTTYSICFPLLPRLDTLNIDFSTLTDLDAASISCYLFRTDSIKKLKFHSCTFTVTQFKLLALGLAKAKDLEDLDFSGLPLMNTNFNDEMAADLCMVLSTNPSIKSVNLAYTHITKESLRLFLDVIKKNPRLRFFYHSLSSRGSLAKQIDEALYTNRLNFICQKIMHADLKEGLGKVMIGNFEEIKLLVGGFARNYPKSDIAKLLPDLLLRLQFACLYGASPVDSFVLNNIAQQEVQNAFRIVYAHLAAVRGNFLYAYCIFSANPQHLTLAMSYRLANAAMTDTLLKDILSPIQRRQVSLISLDGRLVGDDINSLLIRVLKEDTQLINLSLLELTGTKAFISYVIFKLLIEELKKFSQNFDFTQLDFAINTEEEFQAWMVLIKAEIVNIEAEKVELSDYFRQLMQIFKETILPIEHFRCIELMILDPVAVRDKSIFSAQKSMTPAQAFALLTRECRARVYSKDTNTIETRYSKLKQDLHQTIMDNITVDFDDDQDHIGFILKKAKQAIEGYQILPRDLAKFKDSHLSLPALLFNSDAGLVRAETYSQLLSDDMSQPQRMAALYYLLKYSGGNKIKECIYHALGCDELFLPFLANYLLKQAQPLDLSQPALQKSLGLK